MANLVKFRPKLYVVCSTYSCYNDHFVASLTRFRLAKKSIQMFLFGSGRCNFGFFGCGVCKRKEIHSFIRALKMSTFHYLMWELWINGVCKKCDDKKEFQHLVGCRRHTIITITVKSSERMYAYHEARDFFLFILQFYSKITVNWSSGICVCVSEWSRHLTASSINNIAYYHL